MQTEWQAKKEKLHSRNITITTYEYDDERIIVEGILKDDRYQKTHVITGEMFPAGVIHHLAIRLLVNCANLLIEDIAVDMAAVPRKECRESIDCLVPLKGMAIAKGFTARVKKMVGGNKGCTHLVELILAMAPAAVQGFGAHESRKPANINADQARMISQYLINTCHAWREEGPLAALVKEKIKVSANKNMRKNFD